MTGGGRRMGTATFMRTVFAVLLIMVQSAAQGNLPSVSGVIPSPISWKGGTITVRGNDFPWGIATVTVGGKECSDAAVESFTEVTCIAPPSDDGETEVVLKLLNGSLTLTTATRYAGWPWSHAWSWNSVASSESPPPRYGHTLIEDGGGGALLFGGAGDGVSFADLWQFFPHQGDELAGNWAIVEASGAPIGRSEHAACTPSPGVMIVHGGWDQFSGLQSDAPDVGGGSDGGVGEGVGTAPMVHNDTLVVSLASRLWSRIATGGGGPGAARGSSMSCTGGAAYLFGGHGSGIDFPGTIQVLSPNSTLWRMAPGEDWVPVDLWSNSKPPPLSYATMNHVSGNLYLFGGLGARRDASTTLWRFTPVGVGGKWDAMMATGVGRLMHSAATPPVPAGDAILIHGGTRVNKPVARCACQGCPASPMQWADESCDAELAYSCTRPRGWRPPEGLTGQVTGPITCDVVGVSGPGVPPGVAGSYLRTAVETESNRFVFQSQQGGLYLYSFSGIWAVGTDYTILSLTDGQAGSPMMYSAGSGGASALQPHLVTGGWIPGVGGSVANISVVCSVSDSYWCNDQAGVQGSVFGSKCWTPLRVAASFNFARSICSSWGGSVSKLESYTDVEYLSDIAGGLPVWIGLLFNSSDSSQPHWQWQDGSPPSFPSPWSPGEPDGWGFADPFIVGDAVGDSLWLPLSEGANESTAMSTQCGRGPGGVVMGSLCRIGSSGEAALAMGGDAGDAGISQVSSILRTLSPTDMDPPRVELSEPAPALGAPGAVVRVSGIGLCASPVELFIGGNACEGAEALGISEIECTVPHGAGTGLLITANVRGQMTPPSAGRFSYAPPAITLVSPSTGVLWGGSTITIEGRGFGVGVAFEAYIDGSPCAESAWVSDTAALCVPAAVPSATRALITVKAGGQTNTEGVGLFDYVSPILETTSISPASALPKGHVLLQLNGSDFSRVEHVLVGPWPCHIPASTPPTRTSLFCTLGSGIGENLPISMRVLGGGTFSASKGTSGVHFSYERPRLTGFASVSKRYPAVGSRMSISGLNFGTISSPVTVRVGDTAASTATWVDDRTISCNVAAGVGTGLPITVNVALQDAALPSPPLLFSYDSPTIISVRPSLGPASGVTAISISGVNFGPPGANPPALNLLSSDLSNIPAANIRHVSDSLVTFSINPGNSPGTTLGIAGQIGGRSFGWNGSPITLTGWSSKITLFISGDVSSVDEEKLRISVAEMAFERGDADPDRVFIESILAGSVVARMRLLGNASSPSQSQSEAVDRFETSLKACCSSSPSPSSPSSSSSSAPSRDGVTAGGSASLDCQAAEGAQCARLIALGVLAVELPNSDDGDVGGDGGGGAGSSGGGGVGVGSGGGGVESEARGSGVDLGLAIPLGCGLGAAAVVLAGAWYCAMYEAKVKREEEIEGGEEEESSEDEGDSRDEEEEGQEREPEDGTLVGIAVVDQAIGMQATYEGAREAREMGVAALIRGKTLETVNALGTQTSAGSDPANSHHDGVKDGTLKVPKAKALGGEAPTRSDEAFGRAAVQSGGPESAAPDDECVSQVEAPALDSIPRSSVLRPILAASGLGWGRDDLQDGIASSDADDGADAGEVSQQGAMLDTSGKTRGPAMLSNDGDEGESLLGMMRQETVQSVEFEGETAAAPSDAIDGGEHPREEHFDAAGTAATAAAAAATAATAATAAAAGHANNRGLAALWGLTSSECAESTAPGPKKSKSKKKKQKTGGKERRDDTKG